MGYIRKIIEDWRKRKDDMRIARVEMRAEEIFGIVEYRGQLWFTCNNLLFCPCSLVCEKDEASFVAMLMTIRKLYIERNR